MTGIVYSETVIWAAPSNHTGEVPYQLAIAEMQSGERITVRITGERVGIGDRIEFTRTDDGVPVYTKVRLQH